MKIKKRFKQSALLVACSSFAMSAMSFAANTYYAPGDLVLFFQQQGGTNTVYANLGNAATLYRGATAGIGASDAALTSFNILDLNTTLNGTFGAGWASDTSLYAGLAGVWGTSGTSPTLQDGDPHRTLYVSKARGSVGTVGVASSTAWNVSGDTAMSGGATNIANQNNVLENSYTTGVAVSPTGTSTIDNQNLFTAPGVQGTAFNTFAGGVQQRGSATSFGTFDGVGQTEFALDLYRILAKNDVAGQVDGVPRKGSFEGTVVVGTNGQVSFLTAIPEPSSLLFTGMLTAGGLTLRSRRRRSA